MYARTILFFSLAVSGSSGFEMITLVAVLLLISFNYEANANSRTNFLIKRLELCNDTQGLIEFYGNVTEEAGYSYITNTFVTPVPLDEHIGVITKIETKVANLFVELFVVREKYACKAGNIYGGEFWYDMQRAAQIIQGKCPIPSGRYHMHHHMLDFQRISLQTFPFGELRFTGGLVDNKHPQKYLLCLVVEVENILN